MISKSWAAASTLAMAVACASPAWAQDATPAGDPPSAEPTPMGETPSPSQSPAPADEVPGEIVVTAQKRSQRLQDVPVAVSVISGAAIAAQGGVNLENAQYLVPTLTFRKSGTSINQSLFLRGVGTSTFSIAGEPSVSTVLDGVVYSRAGEAFADLVDIERIEVLRGPQGTLFGKNASAGVVNIVSRRPERDFGGFVEAGYFLGEGTVADEYRGRVALNVPLGENVRSRVTGFYTEWDGNIRNETVDRTVNGFKRYGVRGIVVADVTPDLQLTLIGDWRRAKDDCCAEVIGTLPNNLAAGALPEPRGDRTRRIRQNLVTRTDEESYGFSAQVDGSIGEHTVTSITAYRNYKNDETRDGDFLPQAFVGFNQLHDFGPQTGETVTQELRLTSPNNQPLEYVIGGFFSRAESERTFTRNDIVCTVTPARTVLTPCGAAGVNPSTRPTGTATFGSVFNNLAVFGQGTFAVTEQLRLIAGLRYTHDELSVDHVRVSPLVGPGIQPSFGPFIARTSKDNVSGRAGVQFEFSRASTAYATYARGYKGPAYNVFFNLTQVGTNVIDAETADSFEVGLKNTLLGGRLVINLAGYYAKYKNFQANNLDVAAGVVVTRFTNAGDVSTRGGELDLIFQPVPDLNISGGLAYTDAQVDEFRVPPGGNPLAVVPSGTALPYAPKLKATLGLDY
ncbi:MAG TPA: TonB-dependent receptor, partial [Sphingomonadaceae bacterium]|nr:TonB-dependent receptor [Sphingomonadaceae bacterium]